MATRPASICLPVTHAASSAFKANSPKAMLVPRLWAAENMRRMLGTVGEPEGVRGKIIAMGIEYGLMTPFTSFIALESEQAFRQQGIPRRQSRLRGVRLSRLDPLMEETVLAQVGGHSLIAATVGCLRSRDEGAAMAARMNQAAPAEPAPDVAKLLTNLTTKSGYLPQGGITSSYIANLVMWRHEPLLQAKFAALGITYSRYVDDMAMSWSWHVDKETQTWVIAQVYGMLARHGLKAGRAKHEVFSASEPMIATKLIVNRKPSLSAEKRSQVRSQVYQLERAEEDGTETVSVDALAIKASQRVGQLGRFHVTQAAHLRERVKAVRSRLSVEANAAVSMPTEPPTTPSPGDLSDAPAPWE